MHWEGNCAECQFDLDDVLLQRVDSVRLCRSGHSPWNSTITGLKPSTVRSIDLHINASHSQTPIAECRADAIVSSDVGGYHISCAHLYETISREK